MSSSLKDSLERYLEVAKKTESRLSTIVASAGYLVMFAWIAIAVGVVSQNWILLVFGATWQISLWVNMAACVAIDLQKEIARDKEEVIQKINNPQERSDTALSEIFTSPLGMN